MPAFAPKIPLLAALLLGVAMVATLGWQGYRFWQQELQVQGSASSTSAGSPAADTRPTQPDVPLASLDVFGQADANREVAEVDTDNLPETNLRLTLRGILAGSEEQPGSALIEDDRGRTEVYIKGDELPGDATLRALHANRIVLERGGKLENLYFPELDDARGVTVAAANNSPAGSDPADASASARPASRPAPTSQDTDERREQIRERLEQLRQRLRDNN